MFKNIVLRWSINNNVKSNIFEHKTKEKNCFYKTYFEYLKKIDYI